MREVGCGSAGACELLVSALRECHVRHTTGGESAETEGTTGAQVQWELLQWSMASLWQLLADDATIDFITIHKVCIRPSWLGVLAR